MVLLLKPTLACNNNCPYCYERSFRHYFVKYDINKMLKVAESVYTKEDGMICLHGGEPLLLPLKDIEKFLAFAKRKCGYSNVTTNGILISEEHIKLFKKYKTGVAVSLDGLPKENVRSPKNVSEKILRNLELLRSEDIPVSIMVVLHRRNYQKIVDFVNYMYKNYGIREFKFNWLKFYPELELTGKELFNTLKLLAKIHIANPELSINPIDFMLANLSGSYNVNDCFLTMCDIFCTERAKVVLGDGTLTTCLQAQNHVLFFSRSETPSYERYIVLKKIPVQDGGCSGCKYWCICYGGCPASAPDWRMKDSQSCYAIYNLYEFLNNIKSEIYKKLGIKLERIDNFEMEKESKLEDKPIYRIIRRHPVLRGDGVKKNNDKWHNSNSIF